MVRTSGRAVRGAATLWIAAALAGMGGPAGLAGCKSGDGGDKPAAVAKAAADQDKIGKEEEDLLARRDALLNTRLELKSKQAELAERREAIQKKGGDTSEIDKESADLAEQEQQLVSKEKDLNGKLDSLLSERRAMVAALTASASGAGQVAAREAAVAAREKDLARREARLAEREAQLETREQGLASKWKESCAGGATTIVETVDAKGSKYSKRDVEPLLARARSEMNRKGILQADLPDPARNLEAESTSAMAKGDYGRAHFAANQLYATVRSMRVDKAFIAGKISRLNSSIKGKKLSESQRSGVEQLFRAATASYGDGKFASANRQLNKIYAALN